MQPSKWHRTRLSLAVSAAVVAAHGSAQSSPAMARAIETVTVTATKRAESAQDIAVPVQAVTGETLRELRTETFDQYAKFLPNVLESGNGPGKKDIYIRGSATEQPGVSTSTEQGSAPSVALYIDEQPVSFGGRNLDIYAVDIERIEVLAGPQGTLFGASSQSGNLRLITRKPDPLAFDAGFNSRYSVTAGGAPSAAVDGFANLPVSDALALRAVVYSDTQGGWVDNVPATFTPSAEVVDRNSTGYGPLVADADSVQSARNDGLVQSDWNEANYRGARLSASYDLTDDWDLLLQHMAQTLRAEGSFLVDPSLSQANASATFTPDVNRDEFGLTTWTLSGRMASLDVIYTGGNMRRAVDSVVDYTHYNAGGGYVSYYLCSGNLYDATDPNNCYDPTKQYTDYTRSYRTTHELRIATDAARRWRVLGGIYLNDMTAHHVGDYSAASLTDAFSEHISNYNNDNSGDGFLVGNVALQTPGVNTSTPRAPDVSYLNDFTRTEEETAVFAEVALDLNEQWSVSLSGRRYDLSSGLQGATNFAFGCRYGIGPNSEATADGRCNPVDFANNVTLRLQLLGQYAATGDDNLILSARSPNGEDGTPRDMFRGGGSNEGTLAAIKSGELSLAGLQPDGSINETDTILHATLSWRPTNDLLLFATFAEGYRPATLNRNAGQLANRQVGVFENYAVPPVALTDHLYNYELGFKGDFANGLARVNATVYQSNIDDLQLIRYDSINVAFNYFMENVGDARARGLEVDFAWLPTAALTISGAFSMLDTELTRLNPQLHGIAVPVGAELPLAPRFAGNLRLRYDFAVDALGTDAYVLASALHRGSTLSGMVGKAEFMEDTLWQQTGQRSGLQMHLEGGTYGSIEIPDGDGRRLPVNSRYVNPAATTFNIAVGLTGNGWGMELFLDNAGNERAPVAQVGGRYLPVVTERRPRTLGLRLFYNVE